MEIFKIEIQEFLSRIVEVEATSTDEAISIVHKMYKNEEIVLDSDDYVTTGIDVFPKKKIINFDTLSNGNNFYLIAGSQIIFWGNDIESKRIELTPDALNLIKVNNIPINEPCEFMEYFDFKLFTLLYNLESN